MGGQKNFLLAPLAEFVPPLSKPWRRPWMLARLTSVCCAEKSVRLELHRLLYLSARFLGVTFISRCSDLHCLRRGYIRRMSGLLMYMIWLRCTTAQLDRLFLLRQFVCQINGLTGNKCWSHCLRLERQFSVTSLRAAIELMSNVVLICTFYLFSNFCWY